MRIMKPQEALSSLWSPPCLAPRTVQCYASRGPEQTLAGAGWMEHLLPGAAPRLEAQWHRARRVLSRAFWFFKYPFSAALGPHHCVRDSPVVASLMEHGLWSTWALGLWCSGLVTSGHVGSSPTRNQIRVPCVGRRICNHWTTRGVPVKCILKQRDPFKTNPDTSAHVILL